MKFQALVSMALVAALLGCNGNGGGSSGGSSTAPGSTTATATPTSPSSSTTTPSSSTTPPATTTAPPATTTPPSATTTPPPSTTTPPSGTLTPVAPTKGKQTVNSSSPTNTHMQYALFLINQSRAMYGLNPVKLDTVNGPCALRHAQDVWACANGSLAAFSMCSHNDFKKGDTCNNTSENQGVSTNDNDPGFAAIHTQMMNEGPPPAGTYNHFWVITNPTYTSVAIGEYVDPNGTLWVSEEWK